MKNLAKTLEELYDKGLVVKYVAENPNRLSERQMLKFNLGLFEAMYDDSKVADEVIDFLCWARHEPGRIERFRRLAGTFLMKIKAKNVLEVGCGPVAALSELLARDGFKMTAMDPALEIAGDGYRRRIFHQETNLDGFDAVVAQEPCAAAESIVRACVSQDTPFILQPCGEPHELLYGGQLPSAPDWWRYLADLDRRVKLERVPNFVLDFSISLLTFRP